MRQGHGDKDGMTDRLYTDKTLTTHHGSMHFLFLHMAWHGMLAWRCCMQDMCCLPACMRAHAFSLYLPLPLLLQHFRTLPTNSSPPTHSLPCLSEHLLAPNSATRRASATPQHFLQTHTTLPSPQHPIPYSHLSQFPSSHLPATLFSISFSLSHNSGLGRVLCRACYLAWRGFAVCAFSGNL